MAESVQLPKLISEVRGAIGQVAQVVNAAPEDTRTNGLRMPIKGEVSFKDVRFRYSPGAPFASRAGPRGTRASREPIPRRATRGVITGETPTRRDSRCRQVLGEHLP